MPGRERTVINEAGRIVVDPLCRPMALSIRWDREDDLSDADKALVSKSVMPGLDACLCRCEACTQLHPDGIWWVDASMRHGIAEDKKARRKQAAKL